MSIKNTERRPLTRREEFFCWHYAATQNAREAAVKAGFNPLLAERSAVRLLKRAEVCARIGELTQRKGSTKDVCKGLERLAFGSVADAVALLLAEDSGTLNPEKLDLFSIAEIKKPKGGGFEIKFYDRLKALEALASLESERQADGAAPFYAAIEKGVCALKQAAAEDEDELQ
ncbi:terminase small subunit [Acetanaerobacterium elongatum]|uniref:terminase small subunit n=1 Tax=Acetanaerobacterium elongatum TaxID=258515 RepID=UPI001FA6D866|nr:terminase small subunit [Acetanaerobacterium elongatum]